MSVSEGSLLSLETFDLGKDDESAFLFSVLCYFSWVAEILAADTFEINMLSSKEQPRSSGQVSALFLFDHSAFLYISSSDPFLVYNF